MARYAELFAGIGGLGEGFRRAGAEGVYANEYDKFAASTYAANNPGVHVDVRDVREVAVSDIPDHDILLAGFPCQPFSVAGISKRRSLGMATGMHCHGQGNLFFEAARIIGETQPPLVVLENVKNLVTHDNGRTFRVITATLQDLGYAVNARLLDAAHWVPQHRERVFVVAVRGGQACDLDDIDIPQHAPALIEVLHRADGCEDAEAPYTYGSRLRVSDKYTLSDRLWDYLQAYKARHRAKGNGFGYSLVGPQDRARTLSARYYKDGSEILVRRHGNPRRLTPRECSRLMGFDRGRCAHFRISVSDNQAYKQFGNAVSPPVAQAVARVAMSCLSHRSSRCRAAPMLAKAGRTKAGY